MVIDTAFPGVVESSLDRLLSAVEPETARILDRALNGVDIEVEEAIKLFDAKDLELHALCAAANELRKRTVGDMVTFVTVRNINFTNICYTGCKFCAFAKHFGDEEAETPDH